MQASKLKIKTVSFLRLDEMVAAFIQEHLFAASYNLGTRPKNATNLRDTLPPENSIQHHQISQFHIRDSGATTLCPGYAASPLVTLPGTFSTLSALSNCVHFVPEPSSDLTEPKPPELQLQGLYPPMLLPSRPAKPRPWFAQTEAIFNLCNVVSQQANLYFVITANCTPD